MPFLIVAGIIVINQGWTWTGIMLILAGCSTPTVTKKVGQVVVRR